MLKFTVPPLPRILSTARHPSESQPSVVRHTLAAVGGVAVAAV